MKKQTLRQLMAIMLSAAIALPMFGCGSNASPASSPASSGPGQESVEASGETVSGTEMAEVNSETDPGADLSEESSEEIVAESGEKSGEEKDPEILDMIAGMTTEEKLAQMMIVTMRSGTDYNNAVKQIDQDYADLLSKYDFGGVILFVANIEDTAQTVTLIHDIREAAARSAQGIPMFICVDQEGGIVNRVSFGTTCSGNMALAATGDTSLTEESAGMLGDEIKALGFNMDFAPVCDVNSNPANPIIGVRAFSDDPELTAEHVTAFIKGLNAAGISSALKHFPGHGNVDEDSHTHLPCSDLSLEELKECELVPFQAGIDEGTDMIMTAHIQFPQIEKETYVSILDGQEVFLPATLSRTIITGLLRDQMGYDGVVITDAMDMKAIDAHFDPLDAAVLAINADVDILLCAFHLYIDEEFDVLAELDRYMSGLVSRIEAGEIREEELDDSVYRILKLKKQKASLMRAGSLLWRNRSRRRKLWSVRESTTNGSGRSQRPA